MTFDSVENILKLYCFFSNMKLGIDKIVAFVSLFLSVVLIVYICLNSWKEVFNGVFFLPETHKKIDALGIVGALMAIANALLLYMTLSFQGRSFRQERFETTLFSLLDNHRKLVNTINFKSERWNWDFQRCYSTIEGYGVFDFAIIEINYIRRLILESTFPKMDDALFQESIADIENKKDESCTDEYLDRLNKDKNVIIYQYELYRHSIIYKVNEDKWNICKFYANNDKKVILKYAYAIFYEKMKLHYDVYFNSLSLMLMHIGKSRELSREEKVIYKDYITKQITKNEREMIKLHCLYDSAFQKQLRSVSHKQRKSFLNILKSNL